MHKFEQASKSSLLAPTKAMKVQANAIITALLTAFLVGCSNMPSAPGRVTSNASMLDGERQVQVAPAWLHGGGLRTPAKLGGFWTEKAPQVFHLNVYAHEDISGVKVGVDGNVTVLEPAKLPIAYERLDGVVWSRRRFIVPLELIEQMVNAKRAVIQIAMDGERVEGVFTHDHMTFAQPAFRRALKEITSSPGRRSL